MLYGIQSIDWMRLIWVACVFATPQAWAVAQAAEPPPPNIVWLTVEDMSPWIGPYGDATVPTPPAEIDDKAVLRGDSMVFVVSLSCPDPFVRWFEHHEARPAPRPCDHARWYAAYAPRA